MAFRSASSATYTFASGNGATVDLGATNNYRYINATNVYNKGKSEGKSTLYFRLTNSDTYEVKVQTGIIVDGVQIVKSYVNGSYYNSSQDVMPLNNGVVSCRYNKTSAKYISIIVNESCTVNGVHKAANSTIHDAIYSTAFDYTIIPD